MDINRRRFTSGIHVTPVSYSKHETRRLIEMMSSDRMLECPKCGDQLNDVSAIDIPHSHAKIVVVNCHSCNRMALLPDGQVRDSRTF